jgi:uncharacterized protein (DUF885 family)
MDPSAELQQLFQDEWDFRTAENPTFATAAGDYRYNDRLPSVKPADFVRRLQALRGLRARLDALPRAGLNARDRLNYDFFQRELDVQIADLEWGAYRIPILKETGEPAQLPNVILVTPFRTAADYEQYIRRLGGFAALAEDLIDLMRMGCAEGALPSRWAMAGVVDSFRQHAAAALDPDPSGSVFFQPFTAFPPAVGEDARARLAAQARAVLRDSIGPGYRALADFIEKEYLPAIPEARCTPSLGAQRDTAAYYAHCIRRFTSLDLTAGEIHQTGLAEVARIRVEMETVMQQVGFTGSLRAFSDALRSDPRFFVDTPEQLMKEVALLMKRVEGQLPGLFKTLPRTPFGLREIPDYLAPTSTSAYYFLPGGDGTTAGFYYVNTYDLKSRPLYEYEALSMHEAVPGHHLQLALQLEMPDTPPFRKWGETTAFIEGWALYAERLGLEMGFYRDPYANYGRLVYEMWRAARLVVDTGLHAFGWSREQAIAYLAENTALSMRNIANEVDRYIAWPGQALAYKIGELKVRALRARAEAALGARFDVREFHDALLCEGGIPLSVLEEQIEAWIRS